MAVQAAQRGRYWGCLVGWRYRATLQSREAGLLVPLVIISSTTPTVAASLAPVCARHFTYISLFNESVLPTVQPRSCYYLILQKRKPREGMGSSQGHRDLGQA